MPRTPVSTYRLQFTDELGFAAATEIVPWLDRLGVTDVYASPLLVAAPGSTHGYDVADPTRLDPKFGTWAEFEAFSAALRERGMGLVLDIVPNHMAASTANPWWRDVLAAGRESEFAGFFDIDFDAAGGRVVLPILGAPVDEVVGNGELVVEGGELVYFDTRLPLAEGTPTGEGVAIEDVLAAQHYELVHWVEQVDRLNYRRFFDIAALAALRVERPEVFDASHAFVLELVRAGHVTGLRIDHVDGLLDPRAYLVRLQAALRKAAGLGEGEEFWVVVEKILGEDEDLPGDWPVAGTTGYEFLDLVDGLLVDAAGARSLVERYTEVTGVAAPFAAIVAMAKRRTIDRAFRPELRRLVDGVLAHAQGAVPAGSSVSAHAGDGAGGAVVAERGRPGASGDELGVPSREEVAEALVAVSAALPVYRTYVDERGVDEASRLRIDEALEAARADGAGECALSAVGDALLGDVDLVMRWQQFTGPVTAKSVEDTAFYRYNPELARNEVGAHPDRPAFGPAEFHERLGRRARAWPAVLNSTSTHDTKRSEDVRARMLALTEHPDEWAALVDDWLARFHAPDRNDGWMIASTIAGAWPIDEDRLREHVLKSVREAKRRTSWTEPNEAYEAAICEFAEALRSSGVIEPVAQQVAELGVRNSLALVAVKAWAPGVPDTYQGTELERLSLVDPDNRRAVDFRVGEQLLGTELAPAKLRLTAAALAARRANPELFLEGSYLPVFTGDQRSIAFARRLEDAWALVVAPLPGFDAHLDEVLELPEGAPDEWWHAVTGSELLPHEQPIGRLLREFPVAVLLAGTTDRSFRPDV